MGMQGVFIDCVQDGDNIRCPGDGGYSQIILFGKPVRVRKDSVVIELMGRLDELEALSLWGYVETNKQAFKDIAVVATALNTFLATGDSKWLQPIKDLINKSCNIEVKSLGWFTPTDKESVMLNLIRVKVREVERTAVKMSRIKKLPQGKVRELLAVLNQASKYIVQLIYASNVKIYKNVESKLRDLS